MEKTALVPGYQELDKEETFRRNAKESVRLGVKGLLIGYSAAVKAIPAGTVSGAHYVVELELEG